MFSFPKACHKYPRKSDYTDKCNVTEICQMTLHIFIVSYKSISYVSMNLSGYIVKCAATLAFDSIISTGSSNVQYVSSKAVFLSIAD